MPLRCPAGNCVTGKIDEYAQRLKEGRYDRWGADGDLAFLIHFVADLHQPLHAANDQDLGGNCVLVESQPRARNLHAAWDTMIVRNLERSVDSGSPETTAHKLEQKYASERPMDVWIRGRTDDIAWESNQIARSEIYVALRIPIEPCEANSVPARRSILTSSEQLQRQQLLLHFPVKRQNPAPGQHLGAKLCRLVPLRDQLDDRRRQKG